VIWLLLQFLNLGIRSQYVVVASGAKRLPDRVSVDDQGSTILKLRTGQ
jgi:hypothetical protein